MEIYSERQIEAYLVKLGYRGSVRHDWQTLEALQRRHLLSIPYENLDILRGVPLSLTPEGLFRKMIEHPRGGYCFELNGLLSNLLKSLGFDVVNFAGRFVQDDGVLQMRRHRVLKLTIGEGVYICDVGVRQESPRCPLKLIADVVQSDGISEYRYTKDKFYGWVLWQRQNGKDWKTVFGFTEEPQQDLDYIMPSFFCEKHPDSPFISILKASIFTEDSNITLIDDTLEEYRNGRVIWQRTVGGNELAPVLREYFGIVV